MLLRASSRLVLCLCVAIALALPATAQQSASPSPPPQGLFCDAFTKTANGDWVARKDVMVPGPGGMVQIKSGVPADDEMQERLDDLCKIPSPR